MQVLKYQNNKPLADNNKPSLCMPLHQNKVDGIQKIMIIGSHFLSLKNSSKVLYNAINPKKNKKLKKMILVK
jgi:hypothetical protein